MTHSALQRLLDICHDYGLDWCITYNPLKTTVMIFGRPVQSKALCLNGSPITVVDKCKYLGITVAKDNAGKFYPPVDSFLSNFYCTTNAILNVLQKPSEQVLMHLLYTNCVPKLTYACEIRAHSARDMLSMDVALNDSIRKVFTYNRWESTRHLRCSFGYDSVSEMFAKRGRSFRHKIQFTRNLVLISLLALLP